MITRENLIEPRAEIPYVGDNTTNDVHSALKKLPIGIYDVNSAVNAANTYDTSTIMADHLQPEAITQIEATAAPLRAYTTIFDPDPYKPQAKNQIKYFTTVGTTQQSPTSFENTSDTANAVAVSVTPLSQQWSVNNKEFQGGMRIEDGFLKNMLALLETALGFVATTLTTSNFPATPVAVDAASFALSDAATLFTSVKKSGKKSLILDGDYYARLSHQPGFDGSTSYGWTGIYSQSAGWSSAGGKVRGFACAPSAVAVVTGVLLPLRTPIVAQRIVGLGDLGIQVEYNRWINTSTREYWASLDLVIGASAVDTTAGVLLQSVT